MAMEHRNFEGTAVYKGRKYCVLFIGTTRHGHRARLQFLNGNQTFWVNADELTVLKDTRWSGPDSDAKSMAMVEEFAGAAPF